MKWPIVTLAAFSAIARSFGQDAGPAIKAEIVANFIWGEDTASGAISSTVIDPATGYSLHRLSYGQIEVTSRIGFENIGSGSGTLLSYSTLVANSTASPISVRFEGFSIDDHSVAPVALVLHGRRNKNKAADKKFDTVELDKLDCYTSGFLSAENVFPADQRSQIVLVAPQTAQIVSMVVRDPRKYGSIVCSTAGCYPTGTIRYALNVDGHDFIFVWPGRSAVQCGN